MPKNRNLTNQTADTVPYPTAYRISEIILTTHDGIEKDIQGIVIDFTITESLYNPALTLSLNIKDPINLLEELELSGQEKIRIGIWKTRTTLDGEVEDHHMDHEFLVSEYPAYGKFNNHVQVYTLRGISPHAFYNKFRKISRAFSGTIQDFVYEVLTKDLKYNPDYISKSGASTDNISFIVPNLNPIDAISWALRRAYDQTGSPWYCYESIREGANTPGGQIWILPQSDLSSFYEETSKYEEGMFFTYSPNTPGDFEERRKRILSITSSINMSKYISGGNGAYGSTSEYIDIATKKRTRRKFNYESEFSQMKWTNPDGKNVAADFRLDDRSLGSLAEAKINYIPMNSKAFAGKGNYHSTTKDGMINRAHSYLENLDNMSHDIRLAGDFYLNAGNKVDLNLLKSIDPRVKVTNSRHSGVNANPYDLMLSGKYIVTSVVHSFGEQHTCEVRVKRDSMTLQFTQS